MPFANAAKHKTFAALQYLCYDSFFVKVGWTGSVRKDQHDLCESPDTEDLMSAVWNTKWGTRRVRVNPPTLEEAFIAAESLTEDFGQRIEIAASLMGVPVDEVKTQAAKFAPHANGRPTLVTGRGRAVVVQYKRPRVMRPAVSAPRRG